ncbi:TPA: hypothetical protein DCR49_02475 [Candidatus Delongbacteria bacterium]|nr:hypothetical protein [Candidatus Delongbacteria bacterium]
MKKFSKEQITVIAVSIIAMIILAFQVLTLDSSVNDEDLKSKYKSSIDSVVQADTLFKNFTKSVALNSRDIFNLKSVKLRKQVQETESDTVKTVRVKTKWVNSSDLELYGKEKVSYSFYFNGKARFTINGKTQEVKVGDIINVGRAVSIEVAEGTNEPTGNTKTGREYSNKILVITERAVYVDSDDKKRVIRYMPNASATFFARNLMNTSQGDEKGSSIEPADTPGRRPRGGTRP